MGDAFEAVARVGLAGWVGASEYGWDAPAMLGVIGDDLYLVEIDAGNRELILSQLVDRYAVDERSLRIDIVFFGESGGFFASSMDFFKSWPKSFADLPTEVFVDNHYKAAFTKSGDEIAVSVRHALRRDGPPKRRLRFHPNSYEAAMSDVARESRCLRDELLAIAAQRAPQKLESLREAFEGWPA